MVQLSLVFQNQHLISHEENGSHLIINDFGIPEHAFTHILLSRFPQETATKLPYPLKQNKTKQKPKNLFFPFPAKWFIRSHSQCLEPFKITHNPNPLNRIRSRAHFMPVLPESSPFSHNLPITSNKEYVRWPEKVPVPPWRHYPSVF